MREEVFKLNVLKCKVLVDFLQHNISILQFNSNVSFFLCNYGFDVNSLLQSLIEFIALNFFVCLTKIPKNFANFSTCKLILHTGAS